MDNLLPGMKIGDKYTLVEKISEGGGGVVWKATTPVTDATKEVALKVLKWSPVTKSKEKTTDKFKREFELFKKVSHPNIAKIYDFGFDEEYEIYFFTSELLMGGDLRELQDGPIPAIENLLIQALRTLEYLKSFGILHLDIKPQNLLLRKNAKEKSSQLALIDFGLASFHPPDRPGGTPNYMAPEVVARRLKLTDLPEYALLPPPSHKSDLYSLGVSFYYVLTGVLPFAETDENGKLDITRTMKRQIDPKRPPPPSFYNSNVPGYLDAIIMKLIEYKPENRYPSALLASQTLAFRSPNKLEPESKETISAYLPEEGMLIGRVKETRILEDSLLELSKGDSSYSVIVCIAGDWGTGKTRLLDSIIPKAQQMEMKVETNLREKISSTIHRTAFFIDDPLTPSSGIESTSIPDTVALKNLIGLLKSLPRAGCFLAFTVNTELVDLEKALATLDLNKSSCTIIKLQNFTIDELTEYVKHLLDEDPPKKIVEELHNTTFGNPRFISDLFKRMIDEGTLFSHLSGRPDSELLYSLDFSFSHAPTPKSISEHLSEIIEDLPHGAKTLAYRLACFDRAVNIDELENAGLEEVPDNDLAHLISSGIVKRSIKDGLFSFSNPMAAKIIVSIMDKNQRAKMHDEIAAFLKGKTGCREPIPCKIPKHEEECFEISRHLAFGSKRKIKIDAGMHFAQEALKKLHPAEAAELLQELFETTPVEEISLREEVLIKKCEALARMGRFNEGIETSQKLRGLSDDEKIKFLLDLRADEQHGLILLRWRKLGEAKNIFENGLKKIAVREKSDDPNTKTKEIRLKNYLAGINLREGKFTEAEKEFRNTIDLAKKLPAEFREQVTNNELGETLIYMKKTEDAVKIISKDLETARKTNQYDQVASNLRLLGYAKRLQGKPDDSLKDYRKALEIARKHYLFERQLRIQTSIANLLSQMGKWKEAVEEYKQALDLSMRLEGKATSVDIMNNIGLAYNRLGEFDNAIEYLELALDFTKGPDAESSTLVKNAIPSIHVALGHAYHGKGKLNEAEDHLNIVLDMHESKTIDEGKINKITLYNLYATLAEIAFARKDVKKAKSYLPILEKLTKDSPAAAKHLQGLKKLIKKQ